MNFVLMKVKVNILGNGSILRKLVIERSSMKVSFEGFFFGLYFWVGGWNDI